jgi:hypothetical protein
MICIKILRAVFEHAVDRRKDRGSLGRATFESPPWGSTLDYRRCMRFVSTSKEQLVEKMLPALTR